MGELRVGAEVRGTDGELGTVDALVIDPVRSVVTHVVVRSDRPVSYAPAFEAAVRGTEGFTPASVSRLSDYAGKLGQLWWPDTVLSSVHAGIDDKPVEHLGERLSGYPTLVETAVADSYPGDGS